LLEITQCRTSVLLWW